MAKMNSLHALLSRPCEIMTHKMAKHESGSGKAFTVDLTLNQIILAL